MKGQSCARTCSIITIKCNVGELSERPQGIPMDTRSPNVHKESPDYPPHFSVRLQCRPSIPHLSDVFEGPSEGTHTHTRRRKRLWYVLEDLLKSICKGDVSSETLTYLMCSSRRGRRRWRNVRSRRPSRLPNRASQYDHIQQLSIEEVSYTRTIVHEEDHIQRRPYSNNIIYN